MDWQAGDMALCVATIITRYGEKVFCGRVYTVSAVTQGKTKKGLVLKDAPNHNALGWAAYRFIKVTPPEADEFDKETIDLYNKKEKPANAPKPKRIATTV